MTPCVLAHMVVFAGALLTLAAGPAPDDLVRLTIDGARTLPVSPYIYGLNALDSGLSWGKVPPGFTSSRRVRIQRVCATSLNSSGVLDGA